MGCTCKRAHLKRPGSIARCCARLQFHIRRTIPEWPAATEILGYCSLSNRCLSRLRVITDRFSCWSFCSRESSDSFSGFEDKSVIFKQTRRARSPVRSIAHLVAAMAAAGVVGIVADAEYWRYSQRQSSRPLRLSLIAAHRLGCDPILAYQFMSNSEIWRPSRRSVSAISRR